MKIFYSHKQTARANVSFSPSAGKPIKVMDRWLKRGLITHDQIVSPVPVSRTEFGYAHDPKYVKGVLDGTRSNGFGNCDIETANTFPWTTGSMVTAAIHALQWREVAVSPTSGFHHAGYSSGGGFCTFNGLVVAAIKLYDECGAGSVGILDLDEHYGNGTDDIIEHQGLDFIDHYTVGGDSNASEENAEKWLIDLPSILEINFEDSDVVLYQAGADLCVDDPLGGTLTVEQMQRRDAIVFDTLDAMNVPVAWNLAGGYQEDFEKVLDIHENTMIECTRVHGNKGIEW